MLRFLGRAMRVMLLTAATSGSVWASEIDDPNLVQDFLQICAERELSRPLVQELSWLGRLTDAALAAAYGRDYLRLNPYERRFLANFPGSAWGAGAPACRADTLSVVMCGISRANQPIINPLGADDELDAARHFIFAADLTMNLGQDRAQLLLAAHEGESKDYTASERMDLKNNASGLNWANSVRGQPGRYETLRLVRALRDRLRSGELTWNRQSGTRCQRATEITDEMLPEIVEAYRREVEVSRRLMPHVCR